jgi:hypothetical protein
MRAGSFLFGYRSSARATRYAGTPKNAAGSAEALCPPWLEADARARGYGRIRIYARLSGA